MRWRAVRWPWALAISFGVFVAAFLIRLHLVEGLGDEVGLLQPTYLSLWEFLVNHFGTNFTYIIVRFLLETPPFLAGLLAFALLRRGSTEKNDYLKCLRCGHILKGLSEPRCPECGERI